MASRTLHRLPHLKNKPSISLRERLVSQPYRFQFSQGIHLFHRLIAHKASLGTGSTSLDEAVFLRSRVFVSAPPSDLHSVRPIFQNPWRKEEGDVTQEPLGDPAAWPNTNFSPRLLVDVNFLGIAGIQGPLPTPYTEMILSRARQKDDVLRDFLNLFNHRFLSIQYRIDQHNRPSLQLIPPEKTLRGGVLFNLMGLTNGEENPLVSHGDLLGHARFFWKNPRTPLMLGMLLRHYFGYPVEVTGFQGRFMALGAENEMCLAAHGERRNTQLGRGAVLGKTVWSQDREMMVCVTLPSATEIRKFLPFQETFHALCGLIESYIELRSSYRLSLNLVHKPRSCLQGQDSPLPFRLGWTSWLLSAPSKQPAPSLTIGSAFTARSSSKSERMNGVSPFAKEAALSKRG